MESFEIILLLLGCVLASSVFDQLFSRVSLPLVQIALGAVVGFFIASDPTAILSEPEFFLLLFIAPLLFDESRHADKSALWTNKVAIMSLAFGLVFVTTLVVGFCLNWFAPSIPLAAAFALGAALGPTDAAAVAALGKDLTLSRKQKALLSGEALFNDASGVVAFEFAIAAAVTGTFSLANASITFVIELFGSIALGLALGAVLMYVLGRVRALGLETPTVYLLFEICMPFIAYLAAERLELSGILAVVASGLFMKFYPSKLTIQASRYAVASNNIWELLSFVINGIVFVLLGMKLPQIILPTWNASGDARSVLLILLIILLTVVVLGVRFVWIVVMQKLSRTSDGTYPKITRDSLRNAAVTTLSGPKGAVTLAIVLSLPYYTSTGSAFPNRDLLIFLASGVIILTLVLANYVVPLLASGDEEEKTPSARAKIEIEILQNVIEELLSKETPETAVATRVAVQAYRDRINLVREREVSTDTLRDLRIDVMSDQLEFVHDQVKQGKVSRNVGERYARNLSHMISVLKVRKGSDRPGDAATAIAAGAPAIAGAGFTPGAAAVRPELRKKAPITWMIRYLVDKIRGDRMSDKHKREMMDVILKSEERALRYLEESDERFTAEERHAAGLLRTEYGANLMALRLRVARMEAQAAAEAREVADLSANADAEIPEVAPESKKILAAARKREAQLDKVISTPTQTGAINFASEVSSEDAGLAEKIDSAANTMLDAAATASAALVGEETHTGRKVRGTFLGSRRVKIKTRDVEAEALSIELEQIQFMREQGRLTNADARELREEVYMLQMGLEAR